MTARSAFDYTRTELVDLAGTIPRANRAFSGVYRENVVAGPLELKLPAIVKRFESGDRTRRFLLRLEDGETIESVLIPEENRFTFCVSSQVGCALACRFCLTGLLGLTRNLTAGEIVSQVILLRQDIASAPVTRFSVVMMGMGEPLQNYDNVRRAIEILTDHRGLAVALRRITVSTAGLVPGIERLASEPLFPNLSISLTGSTDEVRNELMPINRRYPIREVVDAVRRLPEKYRKRVMFEYVMIKGITDSMEDATRLASLFRGLRSKVNLIPLNESAEIPYIRTDHPTILAFQKILTQNGIATFVRRNRGNDVSGACGQLKQTSN